MKTLRINSNIQHVHTHIYIYTGKNCGKWPKRAPSTPNMIAWYIIIVIVTGLYVLYICFCIYLAICFVDGIWNDCGSILTDDMRNGRIHGFDVECNDFAPLTYAYRILLSWAETLHSVSVTTHTVKTKKSNGKTKTESYSRLTWTFHSATLTEINGNGNAYTEVYTETHRIESA